MVVFYIVPLRAVFWKPFPAKMNLLAERRVLGYQTPLRMNVPDERRVLGYQTVFLKKISQKLKKSLHSRENHGINLNNIHFK
jgi:hypothetical protein